MRFTPEFQYGRNYSVVKFNVWNVALHTTFERSQNIFGNADSRQLCWPSDTYVTMFSFQIMSLQRRMHWAFIIFKEPWIVARVWTEPAINNRIQTEWQSVSENQYFSQLVLKYVNAVISNTPQNVADIRFWPLVFCRLFFVVCHFSANFSGYWENSTAWDVSNSTRVYFTFSKCTV